MTSDTGTPPSQPAPPGSDLNLQDADVIIDLFQRAAKANLEHPDRKGAVVHLPRRGRLLMTGDLHDHGLNFQRLWKLARLHRGSDRYLVLHEVIHGPGRINGRDLSIRTLARAVALQLEYPKQVIPLMANHDLAQLGGEGISKHGVSVVDAFDQGVDFLYGDQADAVRDAMNEYIRSLPLAVRCANGVFCSHSLPSPRKIETFDKTVLDRVPTAEDVAIDGPAYHMVWGRHHNQKIADELAQAWDATVFVMGHQPADMGYDEEGETMLVLASDHEHGMALPIDLSKSYTRDELVMQLIPLASVVM
ncbi:metallophosphoesterase [Phycisphaerales bacterium AB-hyl4]|uniref:Metallophosphoesterase n=1 Tax=Natronomicrosphaera hydrolytica TaxID=3242702 RepID=A0ABV4TZQ7_9BACT